MGETYSSIAAGIPPFLASQGNRSRDGKNVISPDPDLGALALWFTTETVARHSNLISMAFSMASNNMLIVSVPQILHVIPRDESGNKDTR